jgi:Sulfotransferase family
VVKLLASRRPPHLWLFKAPHHNFHLEAILAAYPDARFVQTHRDPVKAVPSWASLVSAIFPPGAAELDRHRLGAEVSNHLRVGVEQAIAARARIGEHRFHDVHHREFVADPLGVVRGVYDFLGYELTPSVERTMAEWARVNRSGAQGTHHYTAEQFGLSDAGLRDEFRFYTDHFDVSIEGAP